jgi:hypothetical protein
MSMMAPPKNRDVFRTGSVDPGACADGKVEVLQSSIF